MLRALPLATLLIATLSSGAARQTLVVLHIRVTVVDAERRPVPVVRHALLISDNPATAAPKRVLTSPEGTVDVRLAPGNYTVESERPGNVLGRSYEWTRMIDVPPGRETTLELNAGNAVIAAATAPEPERATPARPADAGASLLTQWQGSLVTLWTPRAYATGFVVDAKGLIATSQQAIGDATSIEAQLSATVKVAAIVLAADSTRDVAVLWIDPAVIANVRPVPLACAPAVTPIVSPGLEVFTLATSLHGQKSLEAGAVSRIESQVILASFALPTSGTGGPVFVADGHAIGLTSPAKDDEARTRGDVRVVHAADACAVLKNAEAKMAGATPPDGTRLPVESERPLPVAALRAAAAQRPFGIKAYQTSSSDFDIVFITPTLRYTGEARAQQGRTGGSQDPNETRAIEDFGEWSEYVADEPPVLLVRVSPRLVEGFWMKFARGAASTQGVAMPPIKRLRPGFSKMRVLCGQTELTPVHPFTITQRVSETDAIQEGLYAFDPVAIGPHCGSVTLVLSSAKEPGRTETRVVDPGVLRQIWQDFALYRESRD